jgi:hypothetical protein
MDKDIVVRLHSSFEDMVRKHPETGTDFWCARDLQMLLGYTKWENFAKVIDKAITACQGAGYEPKDHFAGIRKMVDLGSGAKREIDDIALRCTGAVRGRTRSGKRGWCSPLSRRHRRRRRRVRVRPVLSLSKELPSIPAIRPLLSRRRRNSLRKCRPRSRLHVRVALRRHPGSRAVAAECALARHSSLRERRRDANTLFDPPTADRRHPVTSFPRAVFAPLTCFQRRPPVRLFCFETAHRAATPSAPLGSPPGGSVEGLFES